MSLPLIFLFGYSAILVALGVFVGRRVQHADGFFVAGRSLGPGLLFATLLAANIGAGSTVGAAGLGYSNGLAAWWWVGAAAIGSLVQAFWIGPVMRRLAAERGYRTVGDYLDERFGARVRVIVGVLLWLGTSAMIAGQLIAMSTLFTATLGSPKWLGCVVGGGVVVAYFSAGGLLSSVWVNLVQLTVLLAGFALAVPFALGRVGGWAGLHASIPAAADWSLWQNGTSGWQYLVLLGPAFIISPGLLQKIFGARDDAAVRTGTAWNAVALFVFAFIPPLLGMIARVLHPQLDASQLALPTLLAQDIPPVVGGLGLAALFSAEVSTADALLFMLSTSVSQDLYKRSWRPQASDADVLRVARWAAVVGGSVGILIALVAQTIVGVLSFFYAVLGVCLFVPVVGGVALKRLSRDAVLFGIIGGTVVMLSLRIVGGERGVAGVTPAMGGLALSILLAALVSRARSSG